MEEFIDAVVGAFARHAPPDTLLVLKHHPHDRAYRDYGRYLATLSGRLGCAERVVYVHDLHLPTLLKHARGTVTMNSTVGLSSLYHRTPVKVLGSAVYDLPGLTCQRPLAEFLVAPGEVDGDLYQCFCRYLIETNQINGSFNRRTPGVPTHSGLVLERAPARSASEPRPTASAAAARR
jgi:capsule polysaccharide modification protein KpsS